MKITFHTLRMQGESMLKETEATKEGVHVHQVLKSWGEDEAT